MWISWIFRSSHQLRKCRLVSSGPLSQRIASGFPRRSITPSSDRVTRRLDKLVSTSKERFSLVKASTTAKTRMPRPVPRVSQTKSSAHSWFDRTRCEAIARRDSRLRFRSVGRENCSFFFRDVRGRLLPAASYLGQGNGRRVNGLVSGRCLVFVRFACGANAPGWCFQAAMKLRGLTG